MLSRSSEVVQLVESLRYKPESRLFDFRWGHSDFLLTQFFHPHYDPRVDSVSNIKEYQGNLLGVKAVSA
jgi:hypothetical protein